VAACLAGAAACTRPSGLVAADGRVVFADGTPVTHGTVEFTPRGGGPAARAAIDTEGRFSLRTGGTPGAVPGDHDVIVLQLTVAEGVVPHRHVPPATGRPHRLVDPRHARPGRSGLAARLESGTANDVVLTVDQAPAPR
jgi:hypothetical protein